VKKRVLLLGCALATAPAVYAQNTIGEVFSGEASVRGSVMLSGGGTHVLSGSQVEAGEGSALVKLERGGEVRICPKTSLSLSSDAMGKSLVLGLSAGAMELNYTLQNSSDSLLTPDFRLRLISPGTFHLAISVGSSGDTCLRPLPGNDAAVFIAETMGNDSYQLSPGKSVMFREGKISGATEAPAVCGCPAAKAGMVLPAAAPVSVPSAATEPVAGSHAGEAHLEVESSFVYRGSEAVQDYYGSVSRLSLSTDDSKLVLALLPHVSGPVTAEEQTGKKKEGKLHRFGKFLGGLFKN
jgi:hypothetical protein